MGSSTERAARAETLYRHDERTAWKSTCIANFFWKGGDRRRRLPMKEGGRLRASGRRLSTISVDKHVDILRTRAPSR
ncbi:hypothetical protein [Burkholderia humptydooensis]|uniref:hypothetical protein n=1 Tax=Burkholderia humptydooensis TaxID=430531 RepID=UPI0003A9C5E5|nr:hypothetical protein [Burkholderia humptydooensis]